MKKHAYYGDTVQKHFVQVIRAVEVSLGMTVPGIESKNLSAGKYTLSVNSLASQDEFDSEVASVLTDSMPIIRKIAAQFNLPPPPRPIPPNAELLIAK